MKYLVLTCIEVEAESVHEAVGRAREYEAAYGSPYHVQVATPVNLAAVEAALMGAVEDIG